MQASLSPLRAQASRPVRILSVVPHTVLNMDILLWTAWGCSLVVSVFSIWTLGFGALAVRSPSWSAQFRLSAESEIQRRSTGEVRKVSQADLLAANRMLGPEAPEPNDEADAKFLSVIQALTGIEDSVTLQELQDRRSRLLEVALTKQSAAVKNIPSIRIASGVWQARKIVSELITFASGLRWFLPPFFSQMRRTGDKYLSTATLIGVWLGLLYWGFTKFGGGDGRTDGARWLTIIGVLITLSTVLGLVFAVGKQYLRVAQHLCGPTKQWTAGGTFRVALFIGVGATFLVLGATGTWQQWSITVTRFVTEAVKRFEGTSISGALLLLAGLCYLIRNGMNWLRLRQMKTSERIGMGTGVALLTSTGAMFLLFIFDASAGISRVVLQIFAGILILGALATAISAIIEWVAMYRSVRTAGQVLPKRGFRWWALWAWGLLAIGISAFGPLGTSLVSITEISQLHAAVSWIELAVSTALFVTFWPGAVITWLFVRRVVKLHNRMLFEQAIHESAKDSDRRRQKRRSGTTSRANESFAPL